jgi:protein-disulfide isomerase
MNQKPAWLMVLVVATLLVAACGPEMVTPTPADEAAAAEAPTTAPVGETTTEAQEEAPTEEPASAAELPVDADDWRVLGAPDAPVTIVEYSDFQ